MLNITSFQERYYEEYNLKGRIKIGTIFSIILFPLFGILDAVIAPDLLNTIIIIRVVVMLANALVLIAIHFVNKWRGIILLGLILVITDTLGIAIMVQFLGGFITSYYQGFSLILVTVITLFPWGFKETFFVSTFIYLSYLLPSFYNLQKEYVDIKIIVINLFFLTSIVIIVLVAAYLMYRVRCRALRARIELENITHVLEESNEKLLELDEMKTQFFENVSHELRTPLTLILAPLAPLIEDKGSALNVTVKETLTTMQHNGLRLLKQINNLLDLSKLEGGKLRLNLADVELVDYCKNILTSVKPLANRRGLSLQFQYELQELNVKIDPEQIENVVLNLLNNAIKFTKEGGRITLSLEEGDKDVNLIVEDSGIGIPEEMLISIFDRFSQVDGSSTRKHEGTGIGLSLVKEIVNLHGGNVRVESKPGKGSRFIVQLMKGESHYTDDIMDRRTEDQPVTFKKREDDSEDIQVSSIISNYSELQLIDLEQDKNFNISDQGHEVFEHTLLVIDDNLDILKLIQFLMKDEYNVLTASSAPEGLEILRERNPDLVLCDVMMPGMDGHSFCRKVKTDDEMKHTPIILVTARAGSDRLVEGIDSGADDYLAKPFNSAELKARVRSMIRMSAVEADLSRANQNLKIRAEDLVVRQRSLVSSIVKSLVSTIDAKDNYTRNHSLRVTEYCKLIAEWMKIDDRRRNDLELAALLHDVGKIAVPGHVLRKPEALTDEEFKQIKEHPLKGEEIINPVVELKMVAAIVRTHHERYDGKGYPDGLSYGDIPIGSRIMSIADTYDAMTSKRPYREIISHNAAVKEILRCSGSQFDPEVVDGFLELAEQFREIKDSSVKDLYASIGKRDDGTLLQ